MEELTIKYAPIGVFEIIISDLTIVKYYLCS
jgi:hypothetical protein